MPRATTAAETRAAAPNDDLRGCRKAFDSRRDPVYRFNANPFVLDANLECVMPDTAQKRDSRLPLLTVRDVTVTFGGIVALNGVTFEMQDGHILGLIGPKTAPARPRCSIA